MIFKIFRQNIPMRILYSCHTSNWSSSFDSVEFTQFVRNPGSPTGLYQICNYDAVQRRTFLDSFSLWKVIFLRNQWAFPRMSYPFPSIRSWTEVILDTQRQFDKMQLFPTFHLQCLWIPKFWQKWGRRCVFLMLNFNHLLSSSSE